MRPAGIGSRKARRSHGRENSISRAALVLGAALVFCGTVPPRNAAAQPQSTSTQSTSQFAAKKPAKAPAKKTSKSRTHGQVAPTADRILEIQQALAKSGNYSGEPNGKMDASTVEAVKGFQTAHGLPVTGKLDARTLQKLGLGSETAGSAAPKTPAPLPASR